MRAPRLLSTIVFHNKRCVIFVRAAGISPERICIYIAFAASWVIFTSVDAANISAPRGSGTHSQRLFPPSLWCSASLSPPHIDCVALSCYHATLLDSTFRQDDIGTRRRPLPARFIFGSSRVRHARRSVVIQIQGFSLPRCHSRGLPRCAVSASMRCRL